MRLHLYLAVSRTIYSSAAARVMPGIAPRDPCTIKHIYTSQEIRECMKECEHIARAGTHDNSAGDPAPELEQQIYSQTMAMTIRKLCVSIGISSERMRQVQHNNLAHMLSNTFLMMASDASAEEYQKTAQAIQICMKYIWLWMGINKEQTKLMGHYLIWQILTCMICAASIIHIRQHARNRRMRVWLQCTSQCIHTAALFNLSGPCWRRLAA